MIKYLLILLPFASIAQSLKTYTGTYEKGQATYLYYEKEGGERVYSGKFHYECEDSGNNYPFQTVDGNYLDGKKNGKWVHNFESRRKDLLHVIKQTFEYKNGKLDGDVTDIQYYIETKDGVKKETVNHKYKYQCRNGYPYGAFNFEGLYPTKSTLTGSIDSMGFADGTWVIKDVLDDPRLEKPSIKFETTRVYKNGILMTSISKDVEKGNVLGTYKFTEPVIKDTMYYKVIVTNYKNVSCSDKYASDCPYKNNDIQQIISKIVPFDFYTITYSYNSTAYAAKVYNKLANSYKENERRYVKDIGKVYLPYSGKLTGIQKDFVSPMARYYKVDTSKAFVEANNRTYEALYRSYMLQDFYAAAFNKKSADLKEYIVTLSKQDQKYTLPEKFWERGNENGVLSNNLYYGYLFDTPELMKPESFLEDLENYLAKMQSDFDSNLAIVKGIIKVLDQKEKIRREIELTK